MNTIKTIKSGKLSGNAYLVQNGDSFILIDTGARSKRAVIEQQLEECACSPGNLKCILLTHADFDHSGNALYLGRKYKTPVGIHKEEAVVLESGDMFIHRKKKPKIIGFLLKTFMSPEKFKPDFYLEDNDSIDRYGINARVIHTPGHSPGSVCILTSNGECFCGDLFINTEKPRVVKLTDDQEQMQASVRKILAHDIRTIFPGHGGHFMRNELTTEPESA